MNAFTSISSSFASTERRPAPAADPFAERCGARLPRGLRTEAAGLTWAQFTGIYAPQGGPLRLGGWSETALPAGRCAYEATVAVGDSIHTAAAVAAGPVGAMTAMLHDLGFRIEILSFHRHDLGDRYVTFLLCQDGDRAMWAMGTAATPTESTLRAMIAGVNRLHPAAPGA